MPCGAVSVGTTRHRVRRQLLDVPRGQNDVAVVGQHDQLLVARAVDRGQDVLHARVHRLAALHHARAQAAEDFQKARRQRRRRSRRSTWLAGASARVRLAARRRRERFVLELHVLDFDFGQRAVVDRELERLARSQRVHVDAHAGRRRRRRCTESPSASMRALTSVSGQSASRSRNSVQKPNVDSVRRCRPAARGCAGATRAASSTRAARSTTSRRLRG